MTGTVIGFEKNSVIMTIDGVDKKVAVTDDIVKKLSDDILNEITVSSRNGIIVAKIQSGKHLSETKVIILLFDLIQFKYVGNIKYVTYY